LRQSPPEGELLVQRGALRARNEPLRPPFEGRRLGRKAQTSVCGPQVLQQNAPRDPVDYEMMDDKQQALTFARYQVEERRPHERPRAERKTSLPFGRMRFDRFLLTTSVELRQIVVRVR